MLLRAVLKAPAACKAACLVCKVFGSSPSDSASDKLCCDDKTQKGACEPSAEIEIFFDDRGIAVKCAYGFSGGSESIAGIGGIGEGVVFFEVDPLGKIHGRMGSAKRSRRRRKQPAGDKYKDWCKNDEQGEEFFVFYVASIGPGLSGFVYGAEGAGVFAKPALNAIVGSDRDSFSGNP